MNNQSAEIIDYLIDEQICQKTSSFIPLKQLENKYVAKINFCNKYDNK